MRVRPAVRVVVSCAVVAAALVVPETPAVAAAASCGPTASVVSWSDALDKVTQNGVTVTGLSSLAWDKVGNRWASAVDRQPGEPARVWFFDDLATPALVGSPMVLTRANGVAFTGDDTDNEGLTVLPDGSFVVASETEPSVRTFSRTGRFTGSLPVPARFRVAPQGQATDNATLEGLTSSPAGTRLLAAMEGSLSGDTGGRYRRFLVYDKAASGWSLTEQVGYQVDAGFRVPDVALVADNRLLVMESMHDSTGYHVRIYKVSLTNAVDVSGEANLARTGDVVRKTLVADLDRCPAMGAAGAPGATNPLVDNMEGLGLYGRVTNGAVDVGLISDDNDSSSQRTRVLHLRLTVG